MMQRLPKPLSPLALSKYLPLLLRPQACRSLLLPSPWLQQAPPRGDPASAAAAVTAFDSTSSERTLPAAAAAADSSMQHPSTAAADTTPSDPVRLGNGKLNQEDDGLSAAASGSGRASETESIMNACTRHVLVMASHGLCGNSRKFFVSAGGVVSALYVKEVCAVLGQHLWSYSL